MDDQRTPHLVRYLPLVAITTLWVAVMPTVVVWELRNVGVIDSVVLAIALAAAIALVASNVGSRIWEARSAASDLLFSDLTMWGWARCWLAERRLASAVKLLDGVAGTEELSRERRERLLVTLAAALEMRDPHTHGHSQRVARHAAMIARKMGLSRHDVAKVRTAAALHDVGKLETPQSILRKPDRLTELEYRVIKLHCEHGAEMVSILGDPQLTAIVRSHHERVDGTGYPDGLAGDEIPLGARIIAVADTFDAITSTRPYRPARSHKTALEVLTSEAGRQLDASAVRAFRSYYAGRRPLALWAMLTNLPEKLFVWLGSGANTVAGSVGGAVATSAVASAVAIGAIASPLASSAHLAPETATRPAHGAAGAASRPSAGASSASNGFAAAALKRPNAALVNAGTRALLPTGGSGKGKSAASPGAHGTTQPRPLTTPHPSPTPASSVATGSSGQAAPTPTSPTAGAGSGAASSQSSASGAPAGSPSGSGQSSASHGSSTAGNQGGGQGSGHPGSQGSGSGQGNGSATGQGSGTGGGQGSGSATGQGSGTGGGQGSGSATGQGSGNGGGQGSGSASGQGSGGGHGNTSGTAQSQATTGSAQTPSAHGKSATPN